MMVLAMGVTMTLIACGNEPATNEVKGTDEVATDTTAVAVDTTSQTPEVKVQE